MKIHVLHVFKEKAKFGKLKILRQDLTDETWTFQLCFFVSVQSLALLNGE